MESKPKQANKFKLFKNPSHGYTLLLNGLDISHQLTEIEIKIEAGQTPMLRLTFAADIDIPWDMEAIVTEKS